MFLALANGKALRETGSAYHLHNNREISVPLKMVKGCFGLSDQS